MDGTDATLAAALSALLGAVLGWWVPALIARIPEPEPEPESEHDAPPSRGLPPGPPKVPYVEIAAARHLAPITALVSAVVAAVIGWFLGPTGALAVWVPLVPLGVALAVIDLRVHLLPTWLIRRGYAGIAVLLVAAALLDQDVHALYRAAGGWLALGGFYYVLFLFGGLGFGDVRLARLVGPALGYLGWAQLVLGLFAITLLAGVGGVVAAVVARSVRGRIPYGPFILVGALVGLVAVPVIAPDYLSNIGP